MMYSFLQSLVSFLPRRTQSSLKALWRRLILQKKAAKLSKNRAAARAKYGVIAVDEFIEELRALGITEGDLLFVQTSFNDLYTLESTPRCLIKGLRQLVGATGTLLMPAYTIPKDTPDWTFDVNKEPTYTGVVNEVFRRTEGVIRSLHPRHSICGVGFLAAEILGDHEKCTYADGVGSPFDKMRAYPKAKILTLGLPPGFLSYLHWIEDVEPSKLPFRVHNPTPNEYFLALSDSSLMKVKDYRVEQSVSRRLNLSDVFKEISLDSWRYKNINGVSAYLYYLPQLSRELLRLRDDKKMIHYRRK